MLSFIRATLVLVQALSNHRAFLPPNKTPVNGRYHKEGVYVLQPVVTIFKLHGMLLWCIAAIEAVHALSRHFGSTLHTSICPATRSHMATPLFLNGVLLTVVGMCIRLQCFRDLGQFFTFDLTILPGHKLVTSGCYGYVRHPSYTGSMLIVIGIAFSQLSAGSLAVECSLLGPIGSGILWTMWWVWTFSVGVSRAIAEDKELQKQFGSEWDDYAANTKYWFVPGLC